MKIERASLLTGFFATTACVVLAASSCGRPELPIAVHKTRSGLRSDIQPGERLPLKRVTTREYAGGKPGFYALRSKYDFEVLRADLPRSKASPPKDVVFGDEMVLAGYSDSSSAVIDKLDIHTVVDTGSAGLHVYAVQYTTGDGCPDAQTGAAFDWVAMPRVDRPITVHLDTDRGPPCKAEAPKAKVVCRLAQSATWQTELTVPLQSTVECEAQSEPGARAIVDRNWFIGELAKGSTAKLSHSKAGNRVSFPVDVLGRYAIKLESVDDEGRRGDTLAVVNATPPSDDTYVQFGWSSFSSTDDVTTFPRLDVRVSDVGAKGNTPRVNCSVQGPKPSWCEVTTSPVITLMKVLDTPARYGVTARYLDDRYKGMAIACARIFKKRVLVSESCDDNPRRAGETWEAGILLAAHGMYEHLMPVDAGTDDGGSQDGGSVDATVPVDATVTKKPAPAKPAAAKTKDGG